MDRSYLSDPAVVAAAQDFVCVRLATYESAGEAELLKTLYRGRSSDLENTVFTILSPDGKERLVRSGRSPSWQYRSATAMAKGMREIADEFVGEQRKPVKVEQLGIPYLANVRLGLNVASCDAQRLVVVHARDEKQRVRAEKQLLDLVWQDGIRGEFLYAACTDVDELEAIEEAGDTPAILIVEPDELGMAGRVIDRVEIDGTSKRLESQLRTAAEETQLGAKDSKEIMRRARRQGVHWDTQIPVTDPHSKRGDRRRR